MLCSEDIADEFSILSLKALPDIDEQLSLGRP
jgi:hypothetical protein